MFFLDRQPKQPFLFTNVMSSTTLDSGSKRSPSQEEDATTNVSSTDTVAIRRSESSLVPAASLRPTTTKIATVVDYHYRDIAMKWYQQLTHLGYTSHVIVVADGKAHEFFAHQTDPSYRYESLLEDQDQLPWTRKARKEIWTLRWRYVRNQLALGNHLLLTDSDNIFTKYINLTDLEQFDVIHAFGTKWPPKIFDQERYVICGCLTFLQANARVIRFVDLVLEKCGEVCDDQVVLHEVVVGGTVLHVEWNDSFSSAPRTHHDQPLFHDLPTTGRRGVAKETGHSIMIWDRDFATRAAPIGTEPCPENHWVSMPYYPRKEVPVLDWFDLVDQHCPPN